MQEHADDLIRVIQGEGGLRHIRYPLWITNLHPFRVLHALNEGDLPIRKLAHSALYLWVAGVAYQKDFVVLRIETMYLPVHLGYERAGAIYSVEPATLGLR